MQPIFNEQIKMWSDLGYPLPIEKNKMSGAIPLALDNGRFKIGIMPLQILKGKVVLYFKKGDNI